MRIHLPAHQQVFATFAVYAFALGNFFPRLPAIKDAMGIEEGALGLALIGAPAGTLISLTLAAPLLERLGHRRVLFIFTPLLALFFAIAVHAPGPVELFFLLMPAGLMIGSIEIMINVEADRTEARLGRRIMNRSHAFWSIGFGSAGVFGALMAGIGVSPQLHLALVVLITIAVLAVFLPNFQPAPARRTDSSDKTSLIALPTGPIIVLVAICLSAMLLEGASIDWSAIYMRSVFDAAPFMGGVAVATGAFSQAIVRYYADGFVDRHSPTKVARVLLLCMAIGVGLIVLAPTQIIALLGFALLGAGTSALFPLTISAAAQRTDRPAAINVAALAQFSFMAFLVGPPLLGFVAEHIGLRAAFGICLPLILLSFALSHALGDRATKLA